MALKIISYNVNGIRAAIKKGLIEWLEAGQYDIVCLQETKAHQSQVAMKTLEDLGYHHFWHSAKKKGYSGVATFTKIQPDTVVKGCAIEKYDCEGRILRTDFGDWTLLNCYFPSGTTSEERHCFKMDFLSDFNAWINTLKLQRPNLLVVGDFNIVHTELDIHNPGRKDNPSGYRPEERAWMDNWFNNGFKDAFRLCNPEKRQYSWWSYRAGARSSNKGWRIDYQAVAEQICGKVISAYQLDDVIHSDHCPVLLEIDL